MKGSCKKRGSRRRCSRRRGSKKGGFIFSRRHLRAPCDDTDYVKVAMPNVDETLYPYLIPKREEVKAEYKKCCPKSYLGFSNSHPYCKDMKGYIEKVNAEYKKSEDPCSRNVSSFKNEYGLQKHYEKCCPKGFFGRKNSSKYCKEIDAAISEKRQQAVEENVELPNNEEQDVFLQENILPKRGTGDKQAWGHLLNYLVELGYDRKTVFNAVENGELNGMDIRQAIDYFEKMKKPEMETQKSNMYPSTWQQRMKNTFFRQPQTNTRRQSEILPLEDFGFDKNGKVDYAPEEISNFKRKGGRRTRRRERKTKVRGGGEVIDCDPDLLSSLAKIKDRETMRLRNPETENELSVVYQNLNAHQKKCCENKNAPYCRQLDLNIKAIDHVAERLNKDNNPYGKPETKPATRKRWWWFWGGKTRKHKRHQKRVPKSRK